jgi:hypothetical protein
MLKESLPRKPERQRRAGARINDVTSGGWAPSNPVSAPQQNPAAIANNECNSVKLSPRQFVLTPVRPGRCCESVTFGARIA